MVGKVRTGRSCKTLWEIYNNRKIDFILQQQRKGKKEVTNWLAALKLNFISIDLAENQSYSMFV